MNIFSALLFFIISGGVFWNLLFFQISNIHIVIALLDIILCFLYVRKIGKVFNHLGSLLVVTYIYFSLILYPLLQLRGLMGEKYTWYDYRECAIFGNTILFIFLFTSLIIFQFPSKEKKKAYVLKPPLSSTLVYSIIITGFLLSTISYQIGIGRMGVANVTLPFKLAGIINLTRIEIYPILLLLIFAQNNSDPRLKSYLLLFLVWGVLECFVQLSKSRVIFLFLPLILYYLTVSKKLSKSFVQSTFIILLVFFMMYPIITYMRKLDSQELSISSIEKAQELSSEKGNSNFLLEPYNRIFMSGQHYMNALPYIKGKEGFDFSRALYIYRIGGSAKFETHVIEKFPKSVHHSSGTTGITDAMLIGGKGLAYTIVVIFVLMAQYIDKESIGQRPLIKVFFLLLLLDFVRVQTITYFIDAMALPWISVKILSYYLLKKAYLIK